MAYFRRRAGLLTWLFRALVVFSFIYFSKNTTPDKIDDLETRASEMFHHEQTVIATKVKHRLSNPLSNDEIEKSLKRKTYHPTCPNHPHLSSMKNPYGYIPNGIREQGRVICKGESTIILYPGQIFEAHNIVLDFSKRSFEGDYAQYYPGFIRANCELVHTDFHRDSIWTSLETGPLPRPKTRVNGPVISISRDDCGNTWHALADFLKSFSAGMVSGDDVRDRYVLVLDERLMVKEDPDDIEVCPYHGALDALGRKGVLRGKLFEQKAVFFSKIVMPDDFTGTLNQIWGMSSCDAPEVVGKYVDNLSEYFGFGPLSDILVDRFKSNDKEIHLTVSSRRKKPFAPADTLVGRVIKNEQAMVDRLKKIPGLHVEIKEFFEMEFKDQIKLMHNTDILIGMHGAGLTNIVYTPLDAFLIELIPFTWEVPEYITLTQMTGRNYRKWRNKDRLKHEELGYCPEFDQKLTVDGDNVCRTGTSVTEVDVEAIAKIVEDAVSELKKSRYS